LAQQVENSFRLVHTAGLRPWLMCSVMLFDDAPLQLPDAELDFQADWLEPDTADRWLTQLVAETPWQQPRVRLYGREHALPRLGYATRIRIEVSDAHCRETDPSHPH
jgi:alkylated DNA repair dioxygenase AlkB